MRTVFGTVFYNLAFDYLNDFIDSLKQQDDKDFGVLIINDDIEECRLKEVLEQATFEYEIIHYEKKYTPAGLRIMLMVEALRRDVELLVFGDADDVFSSNRVGTIKNSATNYDEFLFFYNNILTIKGEDVFPPLPQRLSGIEEICDYNFLGMSNTAIRINRLCIDELLSYFEGDQPIFDWYLFSRMLIDGIKGKYVDNVVTYYRYHDNNLVGNQDADEQIIHREIEVKKQHYRSLASRSLLMERKYNEYKDGNVVLTRSQKPHFWWDYTKGGHIL